MKQLDRSPRQPSPLDFRQLQKHQDGVVLHSLHHRAHLSQAPRASTPLAEAQTDRLELIIPAAENSAPA